jgi:hypothetical protein
MSRGCEFLLGEFSPIRRAPQPSQAWRRVRAGRVDEHLLRDVVDVLVLAKGSPNAESGERTDLDHISK